MHVAPPHLPHNFILFELDFDVKTPLLRLLLLISDLKALFVSIKWVILNKIMIKIFVLPSSNFNYLITRNPLVHCAAKNHLLRHLMHIFETIYGVFLSVLNLKKNIESLRLRVHCSRASRLLLLLGSGNGFDLTTI